LEKKDAKTLNKPPFVESCSIIHLSIFREHGPPFKMELDSSFQYRNWLEVTFDQSEFVAGSNPSLHGWIQTEITETAR